MASSSNFDSYFIRSSDITLEEGKAYTRDTSDLKVHISKIYYRHPEYYKVRLSLINKRNGIVYELNKKYKLYYKKVMDWNEYV